MKTNLVLVVWLALAAALIALSSVWSPLRYTLITIGAISMALTALFVGEGIAQDVRRAVRKRRNERRIEREWARFNHREGR
ncbi:hypothetical protein [Streptosporangium lutulentum]|uniref:Pilus assembly protein TadC n=1 Tax=Streptosporangium lutulentum TaxID=1461250 RepID=A0ABT9Q9G4_9ACTN|nr:hypothetical protein [Streptosporangium lutulentum]MDP9843307.1 pilus assembly protein TadC [Streptosporangium lutulentum]